MNSPDLPPRHEFDANPPRHYLDHWQEAADDPTQFGFEEHTPEWAAFRGLAYHNDRLLHFYDDYLREAIPEYESLLLEKNPEDYRWKEMDLSIFYDIQGWYRRLGSFNSLDGLLEVGLRATAILERLADNPKIPAELRESIDLTTATLYHELALTVPLSDKPLFSVISGEALQRYEIALTEPDGAPKVQYWQDAAPPSERLTPPRVRSLQQATGRYHDLTFERLRRGVLEAMGGDLLGEAHPHYVQRVQTEARRQQALALNDFMAFSALGSKKRDGEPLLKAAAIYDWFVVLAIRNKHIVDNSGMDMLRKLASRQVRSAFPREDAPHDGMLMADLPLLSFDMMAMTYDRTGQPTQEVVPVQIKAQGRQYEKWHRKLYVPAIYVLDVKEKSPSSGAPHRINMSLLKLSARALQRELYIPPGDVRALQRQRGKLSLPFVFDI
ncbi:MAG TPA: hypothetical protein VLG13_03600 [Patescibacteria group bacterium]|nr:hypothetical protein [Patescibacteria group bacterium]